MDLCVMVAGGEVIDLAGFWSLKPCVRGEQHLLVGRFRDLNVGHVLAFCKDADDAYRAARAVGEALSGRFAYCDLRALTVAPSPEQIAAAGLDLPDEEDAPAFLDLEKEGSQTAPLAPCVRYVVAEMEGPIIEKLGNLVGHKITKVERSGRSVAFHLDGPHV